MDASCVAICDGMLGSKLCAEVDVKLEVLSAFVGVSPGCTLRGPETAWQRLAHEQWRFAPGAQFLDQPDQPDL